MAFQLMVGVTEGVGDEVLEAVGDTEREGVSETVGVTEPVTESVGVTEDVGVREAPSELVAVGEGVGEFEGVTEGVRETEAVGEGVTSTCVMLWPVCCAETLMTPHVKPVPALTDCQADGVTNQLRASVVVPDALTESCTDVKE